MSCCSKPPCVGKKEPCKKSSSSSGNPIPLNEYEKLQTNSFPLRSMNKKKSSESSESSSKKRKSDKSKKTNTKKVYNPNKSSIIKALLLLSSILSANEKSTVEPLKDPFLGIIDPSIPLKDIVKHKFHHRLQKQLEEERSLVQEEEDEEFKQTLNEIISDYKKTDRSKSMPRPNPNDYSEKRKQIHQKRSIKSQQKQQKNQRKGRKTKKRKEKKY
jgi:hypothetical protein